MAFQFANEVAFIMHQSNIVENVRVDDWTAEKPIVASTVKFWAPVVVFEQSSFSIILV